MFVRSAIPLIPLMVRELFSCHRRQYWSLERLRAFQDRCLIKLVRHAGRHVPYYRELFRRHRIDIRGFRGRRDLIRIPPLDKETLRRNPGAFISDDAGRFGPVSGKTSGSTGTPLTFLLSRSSRAVDGAATLRGYAWAGYVPGMKVFTCKDYFRGWVWKKGMLGRSLDFDTNTLSMDSAAEVWERINRLKPRFFHGYPMSMLMLGILGEKSGVRIHRPEKIISIGESLTRSLREKLENFYQARVYDFYSMGENTALISQCREGSLHMAEDYAFHEILDERGYALGEGRGEIVATHFHNWAMPLIRYRTSDLAELSPVGERCPCGRHFRMVREIEGRVEDVIRTPDGRYLNLIERPLNQGRGIRMAQYIQDRADHVYVNILPGPDFDPLGLGRVKEALKERLGQGMKIDLRLVDRLETRSGTTGKTPFLISRLGETRHDGRDGKEQHATFLVGN